MLKLLLLLLLLLNLPIIQLSGIDLVIAILLLLQLLLRESGLILDSLPAMNVFFGLEGRWFGQGL